MTPLSPRDTAGSEGKEGEPVKDKLAKPTSSEDSWPCPQIPTPRAVPHVCEALLWDCPLIGSEPQKRGATVRTRGGGQGSDSSGSWQACHSSQSCCFLAPNHGVLPSLPVFLPLEDEFIEWCQGVLRESGDVLGQRRPWRCSVIFSLLSVSLVGVIARRPLVGVTVTPGARTCQAELEGGR